MTSIDDISTEQDKAVARDLHEQGKEFTPEQVREIRRSAFAKRTGS